MACNNNSLQMLALAWIALILVTVVAQDKGPKRALNSNSIWRHFAVKLYTVEYWRPFSWSISSQSETCMSVIIIAAVSGKVSSSVWSVVGKVLLDIACKSQQFFKRLNFPKWLSSEQTYSWRCSMFKAKNVYQFCPISLHLLSSCWLGDQTFSRLYTSFYRNPWFNRMSHSVSASSVVNFQH